MGIVNVTPDSFSDGGRWLQHEAAIRHARELVAAGASIVDIGGESTRPGAAVVSVDEECARVLPVVEALAGEITVSIDTRHGEVAEAAVQLGASIINDISSSLWPVAAKHQVTWVGMHMQGDPQTMQESPTYDDVVEDVASFLFDVAARAETAGVPTVIIDPGIGFGKTVAHNCALLAGLERFTGSPYSVLVGTSRKGFLGQLTRVGDDVPAADDRLEASLTTAVIALMKGADIVRVHDVKETVRAMQVVNAVTAQMQSGVLL